MSPAIRHLDASDWSRVSDIYAAGIATGNATFAHTPPSWSEFSRSKIAELMFVAEVSTAVGISDVAGWVACAPESSRCVYSGIAEVSLYVDPHYARQGVGAALLEHIIAASEGVGIWTLTARIFPENTASTQLHKRHGFRMVGVHESMGCMTYGPHQGWRDNQVLERRSRKVGLTSDHSELG